MVQTASALADPSRVRIVAALMSGPDEERCVCEVTELLGLAGSTVSKHLSILRQAGLIEARREGRWMYYRPARKPGLHAGGALTWVRRALAVDPTLIADAEVLREISARMGRGCCPNDTSCDQAERVRVLFLCTGNSCRSQMAEGWAKTLASDRLEAHSAGTDPSALNPLAVRVMQEAGVDISGQRSKSVDEVIRDVREFDCIITVCDSAREACPAVPGAKRVIHTAFDDPPRLAAGARNESEALKHFRRVRDEIRAFIERLPSLVLQPVTNESGVRR